MKWFVFLLLFSAGNFSYAQFNIHNREISPETFIVYLSPITTQADLDRLVLDISSKGFDLIIKDVRFTDQGKLSSFHAEFSNQCIDSPFTYSGETSFTEYPIAVLFIGENCAAGVFTTTYGYMKNMYKVFFKETNPQYTLYGWKGNSLKDVKEITVTGIE